MKPVCPTPSGRHGTSHLQRGFADLLHAERGDSFGKMKTLTVEEAVAGLGGWMDRALAGEQIQIRKGDALVELRPAQPTRSTGTELLSPREALRRLQEDARLRPEQAENYLREVRDERLAAEDRRPE